MKGSWRDVIDQIWEIIDIHGSYIDWITGQAPVGQNCPTADPSGPLSLDAFSPMINTKERPLEAQEALFLFRF